MLLVTSFATVSQTANIVKYHVALSSFAKPELTNVTSQDYVINVNDPWKYW